MFTCVLSCLPYLNALLQYVTHTIVQTLLLRIQYRDYWLWLFRHKYILSSHFNSYKICCRSVPPPLPILHTPHYNLFHHLYPSPTLHTTICSTTSTHPPHSTLQSVPPPLPTLHTPQYHLFHHLYPFSTLHSTICSTTSTHPPHSTLQSVPPPLPILLTPHYNLFHHLYPSPTLHSTICSTISTYPPHSTLQFFPPPLSILLTPHYNLFHTLHTPQHKIFNTLRPCSVYHTGISTKFISQGLTHST